jgi:hypothetical protein
VLQPMTANNGTSWQCPVLSYQLQHEGMNMNKHQLTYIDMYPQPVDTREPSTLVVWLGAACVLGGLYLLTIVLFSL